MTKLDKQLCLLKTGYVYNFLAIFYAGLQNLLEGMVSIGIVEYLVSIPALIVLYRLIKGGRNRYMRRMCRETSWDGI